MNKQYFKFRHKVWKGTRLIWVDFMEFFPRVNVRLGFYNRMRRLQDKPLLYPVKVY